MPLDKEMVEYSGGILEAKDILSGERLAILLAEHRYEELEDALLDADLAINRAMDAVWRIKVEYKYAKLGRASESDTQSSDPV